MTDERFSLPASPKAALNQINLAIKGQDVWQKIERCLFRDCLKKPRRSGWLSDPDKDIPSRRRPSSPRPGCALTPWGLHCSSADLAGAGWDLGGSRGPPGRSWAPKAAPLHWAEELNRAQGGLNHHRTFIIFWYWIMLQSQTTLPIRPHPLRCCWRAVWPHISDWREQTCFWTSVTTWKLEPGHWISPGLIGGCGLAGFNSVPVGGRGPVTQPSSGLVWWWRVVFIIIINY